MPRVGEGAPAGHRISDGRVVGCGAGREEIRVGRGASAAGVSGGRRPSVRAS
jgi:hypothetical protein